jgi:RHS repeat-associated protein
MAFPSELTFDDLASPSNMFTPEGRWAIGWEEFEGELSRGRWFVLTGEQVWQRLVSPEVDKAIVESGSEDELRQRLDVIADTNPAIIHLIAKYRPDLLGYITNADERLQNARPPEEPNPVPANRIDGSDAQGVGPLPPRPPAERGAGDAPADDSGDQGTASSPADGKTGGDPLVLFSGQLYHQVTDLEMRGRGLHFSFVRTHLSQTLYKGPLGYCWDHSYNLWLREQRIRRADGFFENVVYRSTGQLREDRYIQILGEPVGDVPPLQDTADAVFRAPAGFFDRLEKSGGLYVLETVTGVRFEYNEDLYIARIVDRNGNELTFAYTDRLLTKIRDPVGKEFGLEYDEMNRIRALHDLTGDRTILYQYDSHGDLEQVDFLLQPDLTAGTDYRYVGPNHPLALQHNLQEIINAHGHSVMACEYGSAPGTWEYGCVVRQRSAEGEYRYEYGPVDDSSVDPGMDLVNYPVAFTRVFYPNDHCIEHWFNTQGNVVQRAELVLGVSGLLTTLVATYRYNEDALLISETRPDGASVEYLHEREAYAELHGGDASSASPVERLAFGNLLRRIEKPRAGSGDTRVLVTEFAWHPQHRRLASRRGPFYANLLLQPLAGQAVGELYLTYDAVGNLQTIAFPEVELPDGTLQTPEPAQFVYDTHGSLTRATVGPVRTEYQYFADLLRSGFIAVNIADADGTHLVTSYEVDDLGRVTRTIEPYGATTEVVYTTFDAPKLVTLPEIVPDAVRPTIAYQYDRNRQVIETREEIILHDGSPHPDGVAIQRFDYDDYGRLVGHRAGSAADPEARLHDIVLDGAGLRVRAIDGNRNSTVYTYDERLLTASITRGWGTPEETTQRFRYNASAEIVEIVDGRGFSMVTERDGFGRPRLTRDADGNEFETEHDAANRVIVARTYGLHPETGIKVRWNETESRYDAVGRLIETVDHLFVPGEPGADTLLRTQYFYDPLNRLVAVIDAQGERWEYEYDGTNRPVASRDPGGNETRWRYDDAARSATIIDTDVGDDDTGNPVQEFFRRVVRFDTRGLPAEDVDAAGNIARFGFDSQHGLTRIVDRGEQEFLTDYSVFGEPVAYRTTVAGSEIRAGMRYDDNGNLVTATSPIGGETIWTYDAIDRVATSGRSGQLSVYTYDAEDHVINERDANGTSIIRTYTDAGRPRTTEVDFAQFVPPAAAPSYTPAPTPPRTFGYTPLGSIASVHDVASDVALRYDSLERVIAERSGTRTVGYRYDAAGRRTGLIFPDGRDIGYAHSATGGLTAIFQTAAGAAYPGDPGAPEERSLVTIWRVGTRPLVCRLGSTLRVGFAYDPAKRVTAADWTRLADGGLFFRERDLCDSRGEWRVHQADQALRLLTYDDLARLVAVRDYAGTAPIDTTLLKPAPNEAALDTAATQTDIDGLIADVDAATTAMPVVRTFGYTMDANANRLGTEESADAGPITATAYTPDENDRYVSVGGNPIVYDRSGNLISDGINAYRYDAFHQLAEVELPVGSMQIIRDGLSRAARVHSSAGLQEIVYAGLRPVEWRENGIVAGQLVPLERPQQYAQLAAGGADSVPLTDRIDSILGWLALDGSSLGRSVYDPFGQPLERGPAWPAPFGFAGCRHLEPASLYELAARTYHSGLGRFLQRDPLGFADGMNRYAYAHHAPGSLVDYWGFSANDIDWGTVAWEAAKSAAGGAAIIGGAAAAVGAGLVSAPVLAVAGGLFAVGLTLASLVRRSDEAFEAGKTGYEGAALLAALGDTVGITNIIEGAQGRDAVTDRVFGVQERSERLGTGIGTLGTAAAGRRLARVGHGLGARARNIVGGGTRLTTLDTGEKLVPMDPHKLDRIVKNLEAEGVTFRLDTPVTDPALAGALGAYLPKATATTGPGTYHSAWPHGSGPGTIVLPPNASRVAVIHELAHLGQHRQTGWHPSWGGSFQMERAVEIANNMKLLRIKTVAWTEAESMTSARNLTRWTTRSEWTRKQSRGRPGLDRRDDE